MHTEELVPSNRELSVQEAADLMNVSYSYLATLLEAGQIRSHDVEADRRVHLRDLLEYKMRMNTAADRAYADLVRQAQELGMGYE